MRSSQSRKRPITAALAGIVVLAMADPGMAFDTADRRTIGTIIDEICPAAQREIEVHVETGAEQLVAILSVRDRRLASLGEKGRQALLAIASGTQYTETARRCALSYLGHCCATDIQGILYAIARDPSEPADLRRTVLDGLGEQGDPVAEAVLLEIVEAREDAMLGHALRAVIRLNSPRVRAAVREVLRSGRYPSGHFSSLVNAVGKLRDTEAIPLLWEIALEKDTPSHRYDVALALAEIGSAKSRRYARDMCMSIGQYPPPDTLLGAAGRIPNARWRFGCAEQVVGILQGRLRDWPHPVSKEESDEIHLLIGDLQAVIAALRAEVE